MPIHYEWVTESGIDEHGDIGNVNHSDTFPGFPKANENIGLVRDTLSDLDGDLVHRCWAYIKDGVLPEYFSTPEYSEKHKQCFDVSTGMKVPKRFFQQVAGHKE